MQSICLLFAGRRGLEDQQTRQAILRIPEVSRRISQAQIIVDQFGGFEKSVDLFSFVSMNDDDFNIQKNLKALTTSIVQVALYDRYIKFRNRPEFLIGLANETSALKVCADHFSFSELVIQSEYCQELQREQRQPLSIAHLMGESLEEYCVYRFDLQKNSYQLIDMNTKDSSRIIEKLISESITNQCIHIGPHFEFRLKEFESLNIQGLSSMNSIDLDPILSSFWKSA